MPIVIPKSEFHKNTDFFAKVKINSTNQNEKKYFKPSPNYIRGFQGISRAFRS